MGLRKAPTACTQPDPVHARVRQACPCPAGTVTGTFPSLHVAPWEAPATKAAEGMDGLGSGGQDVTGGAWGPLSACLSCRLLLAASWTPWALGVGFGEQPQRTTL